MYVVGTAENQYFYTDAVFPLLKKTKKNDSPFDGLPDSRLEYAAHVRSMTVNDVLGCLVSVCFR